MIFYSDVKWFNMLGCLLCELAFNKSNSIYADNLSHYVYKIFHCDSLRDM